MNMQDYIGKEVVVHTLGGKHYSGKAMEYSNDFVKVSVKQGAFSDETLFPLATVERIVLK